MSHYILHFELVELLSMDMLYLDVANWLQGLRRLAQGANNNLILSCYHYLLVSY